MTREEKIQKAVGNFKDYLQKNPQARMGSVIDFLNECSEERLCAFRQSAKLLREFIEDDTDPLHG